MASAFDDLTDSDAEYVRKRLLAGETMADIRRTLPGITAKLMRALRDEVFEPLQADPEAVKGLANGPVLNALEIVRYRRRPGRKTRMARPAPVQTEMFPA
jgi:hypothetical protein